MKNIRWVIAALLFLASVINYIDRQTLSVVAPQLTTETTTSSAAEGDGTRRTSLVLQRSWHDALARTTTIARCAHACETPFTAA